MPASATNKSNLSSIESAINTLESNISTASGSAQAELKILCKQLRRDIALFRQGIQGLN